MTFGKRGSEGEGFIRADNPRIIIGESIITIYREIIIIIIKFAARIPSSLPFLCGFVFFKRIRNLSLSYLYKCVCARARASS